MAAAKPRHLVIVESPTKANTLRRVLGRDYAVEATSGHVIDLPKKGLAVDVDGGFEPEYVTVRGKGRMIQDLRKRARDVDDVLIATDPDREGEAIGYHIALKLGYEENDGRRFRRVRFNEFTKDAVLEALAEPGDIDLRQVEAQQARRILDRLVGYGLSPLLWKKISPVDPVSRRPLSAGRVQSVAVRLLVERERERRRFRTGGWWDIVATLAAEGGEFEARLETLDGTRVASGRDFDSATGRPADAGAVVLLDEAAATALAERLAGEDFQVTAVEARDFTQSPYAPFRTSTLQQEANRKLGLSARETMRVAQRLYEDGHITYMRTDSTRLSGQAIAASRRRVEEKYGDAYLSPRPRNYGKQAKGAQEAHEAIRPAGTAMRTSDELGLSGIEAALYDLIWKRTMATQMADARRRSVTATVRSGPAEFRASGRTTVFPGFLRAYVEGSDDPEAALDDREEFLPPLAEGDRLTARGVRPEGHETRPPARYNEAALIKALEAEGIGRPSTYAPTIATIVERGYVDVRQRQLVPTFLAFAVTRLLEEHFEDLVDLGFTSRMEADLDRIADGDVEWRRFLEDFYRGPGGFEKRLADRAEKIDPRAASGLPEFDDLSAEVRIGRFGPFLEQRTDGEPLRVTLPEDLAPGDLTPEVASRLLEAKQKADEPLGTDPETGLPVRLLVGRYGPFVQLGDSDSGDGGRPPRASLPTGVAAEDVDLEMALGLLSLPRTLGPHPESGEPVRAGIGRYGPYVVHDGDFRSLEKDDDVLRVELERALELLSRPKKGRRRGSPKVLRALGVHPEDEAPVELLDGRYGPYVRHGKTNASLPKDLSPDDLTLERALQLLEEKRARGGGNKGGRSGRKGGRGRSSGRSAKR
ncbi:MAG: type I DNA topoisomerase [Gemmatimonadota bacterium]|nr:type I DNA topoisomerase [Gemmatimonadota bacterium]